MRPETLITGLVLLTTWTPLVQPQPTGADVEWACRDRYLWIHVASPQRPRFEAVDANGVHAIGEQLASRCGYTISSSTADGFTTFKASYYSCFTLHQNDQEFTFSFNVMVSTAAGQWTSRSVSAICSGLTWTHREVTCEEDYMEVNVKREATCGGGNSGEAWQAAYAQAQKVAGPGWQLMFLRSDGKVSFVSSSDAQRQGYSLVTSAQRAVLRSQYKQQQAEVLEIEGVAVEVLRVSLFLKQQLTVTILDMSMACAINSDPGYFDGTQLRWNIPRVMSPLAGEGVELHSRSHRLGVDGLLLSEGDAAARGFSLGQQGELTHITVPFGAEGGFRNGSVVDQVYRETYHIFLLYEHIFSVLYQDGSSVDTRHRMQKVLGTPPVSRQPFTIDQTNTQDQVFIVYLGNVPQDVTVEEVWVNIEPLLLSEGGGDGGYSFTPVVHANGSQAFQLRLPFLHDAVGLTYLGNGQVLFTAQLKFMLTIVPKRESYYHSTKVQAQAFYSFPPQITAHCSDEGITFSVATPPGGRSLFEVGIDQEALTPQLVEQRGYRLYSDTQRTTLEVPVFSVGFTYKDINLSNFYGTFQLVLRDSKTLEVQTSTSKSCLFRTQDMMVCSAGGVVTVVTTPGVTWPSVDPDRTRLLDPRCRPRETDGSRVLFEFQLDSCGTRAMTGDSYIVYENEILNDGHLAVDGSSFISRGSQLKLTVRCFYPLSGVHRLAVARDVRPQTSGVGSVKVLKTLEGSPSNDPTGRTALDLKLKGSSYFPADSDCGNVSSRHQDCPHRAQVHQVHQPAGLRPGPGPRPLLPVHQSSVHSDPSPQIPEPRPRQDLLQVPSHLGLRKPQDQDGVSGYQPPALSHPESRWMTDLGRPGLIDKRNIETVQRIRVMPPRRVILPGQDLSSNVIQPEDVSLSWQTRFSPSAKQQSVQSAGSTGDSGGASPQRTIVLQPAAGASGVRVQLLPRPPARPPVKILPRSHQSSRPQSSRPAKPVEHHLTNLHSPGPQDRPTPSDCRGQYGGSIHQGINRGTAGQLRS
ncbi:uncharacterized protein LOC142882039 [Nelusetta ayraudi]|uniref:uncharacterized protein LOC142882039 n=1 Tax=Nelusetta ayraudi TaxID=303726 RepID=UPI003F71732A